MENGGCKVRDRHCDGRMLSGLWTHRCLCSEGGTGVDQSVPDITDVG